MATRIKKKRLILVLLVWPAEVSLHKKQKVVITVNCIEDLDLDQN